MRRSRIDAVPGAAEARLCAAGSTLPPLARVAAVEEDAAPWRRLVSDYGRSEG